jgi:hypothetical protein
MIRKVWSAIMKWGWDYNRGRGYESEDIYNTKAGRNHAHVEVGGLSFNVMPAQGGTVVQIRTYNRKTDQDNLVTHVVPEGEDITTAIGHIVSMELLKL